VNIIPTHEIPLIGPYVSHGTRVLEFGDKRNPSGLYRDWYESRGAVYTCTDINGRNGAIKQDVRLPFDFGKFDLVTNFGFSEHVSVQRPYWENAYNALEVGGIFAGTTPKPNHWLHHGWSYWHPSESFYLEWAEANSMEVVTLVDCGPGDPSKRMVGYVLRKLTDAEHVWLPEFNALFWRNRNWDIPQDDTVHYGSV